MPEAATVSHDSSNSNLGCSASARAAAAMDSAAVAAAAVRWRGSLQKQLVCAQFIWNLIAYGLQPGNMLAECRVQGQLTLSCCQQLSSNPLRVQHTSSSAPQQLSSNLLHVAYQQQRPAAAQQQLASCIAYQQQRPAAVQSSKEPPPPCNARQ
eukprot:GHRQ01026737.1.p1 GENE.GHRQ01026737.1~~GHRQ01026737.1.p1  ORF type:complete len:153 (+),score=53.86 GHRQ01026737.1:190-648(+)